MTRLDAYELGLITGLEKSGQYEEVLHVAVKLRPIVKAAKLLAERGKSGPKLEKFAAWYNHILPTLLGAVGGGATTAYSLNPIAILLGALSGGGLGLWSSLRGAQPAAAGEGKVAPMAQLKPEAAKLLTSVGIDPELISPIKRPDWLDDPTEQWLAEYGINPMELIWRQRLMERQKKTMEETETKQKAEAAKPISFAQYMKQRPEFAQQTAYSYLRPPAPVAPQWNVPRRPMPETSPEEQAFWNKWVGRTPAQTRARQEPLTWAATRRQQSQDYANEARKAVLGE